MFLIVMGVSGCGKSTIGQMLAQRLGWAFYDADDFHPVQNVAKMSAGIPLTDEDRAGWLEALAGLIQQQTESGSSGVLACSALKESYRQRLRRGRVKFIYLKGNYETIWARMLHRSEHFMNPALLQSQFATLEEPADALTLNIELPPEGIVQEIMESLVENKYSLGILGLGVMGRSLAQNFARNGYRPIGFDLNPKLPAGFDVSVTNSLEELTGALAAPRTVFLMVPAGAPVDAAITSLMPYLQPGDVIIDGGNSYFADTERRARELQESGILYIGMGVSGGESGALRGPSMMPGGSEDAWPRIRPMFESVAAKTESGEPCVGWMGTGGAGHYVKMVHNGIEYGDMQLIAEMYDLLHRGAGLSNQELAKIFAAWNTRELRSYLIEISATILAREDELTGQSLVDMILDEAAQKGTGKWTSQNSFDLGIAIPTINAAVESRIISSLKSERILASQVLGTADRFGGDVGQLVLAAEQALYASKIISYAQGLQLLKTASQEYGWNVNLAEIVRVWRAGCIIRASLLGDITNAYQDNPGLPNLLLDTTFSQAVLSRQAAWREVVRVAVGLGIPMLATCASLAYFDAYRSQVLPANLTQAQRDFFGAHTYRRIDRDGVFHTQWEIV